jgi:hypothetical protein
MKYTKEQYSNALNIIRIYNEETTKYGLEGKRTVSAKESMGNPFYWFRGEGEKWFFNRYNFELTNRTCNALGFLDEKFTVLEFMTFSDEDILSLKNCGKKTLKEINDIRESIILTDI